MSENNNISGQPHETHVWVNIHNLDVRLKESLKDHTTVALRYPKCSEDGPYSCCHFKEGTIYVPTVEDLKKWQKYLTEQKSLHDKYTKRYPHRVLPPDNQP